MYICFLKPDAKKGQEVIYVQGANDGNLIAHEGNGVLKHLPISLKPNSALAMRGNRYPITELGIYNLTNRLVQVAESDRQFGECDVRIVDAKINKRPVEMMEVVHPVPRKNFLFNKAEIFIDKELNLPIRYASYDWPSKPGDAPILVEEYTYADLKLNVGLTDVDFDTNNPNYNFGRKR